jgi:hypothetical protein
MKTEFVTQYILDRKMQNQKINLREKRVKYYYYDLDEDNHLIKKIFQWI